MNKTSFLLDTHAFIWVINGESTLAKKVLESINRAAKEKAVFISAISLWEISMLVKKRKVIFDQPTLEWLSNGLQAPGMNLIPLTPNIAVESCQLPGEFHGDPADRIIIATARIEGLTLVTRDQKILEYGKDHYVNTLRA